MKQNQIIERLTANWRSKALCILIAILFSAFYQYKYLERRVLPVTLNVVEDGLMICTTRLPSTINVAIRTSENNISSVSSTGIRATLDLSYYTREGDYDVPVTVDLPVNLKTLDPLQVTVIPDHIHVHLEENVRTSVSITTDTVGKPAYGYETAGIEVSPSYAVITGPRTVVNAVKSIKTNEIAVDEKNSTFTEKAFVVSPNRIISVIDPDNVEVKVKISSRIVTKDITDQEIYYSGLSDDLMVEKASYCDFTVKGAQLLLDEYEPNKGTIYVDLNSVREPGEYDVPVSVLIPRELTLEKISVETLHLTVEKHNKPDQEEKTGEAE